MKTYTVTTNKMQASVTGTEKDVTFYDEQKAISFFTELCDQYNLDNKSGNLSNGQLYAGGIGYDWSASLEVTNS